MKGISSNTLKIDGDMSYENSQKIKEFTAGFNKGDRIKVDLTHQTVLDKTDIYNPVAVKTTTIIFTRKNNQLLEKLTHSFEKLKNNIFVNKSLFHKPDLIENIFKQPSISVKKLTLIANEIKVLRNNKDMEKSFAVNNKIANQSDLIITGQQFSLEENKINSITVSDKKIPDIGNQDIIDDEFEATVQKANDKHSKTGEAAYLIGRLKYMGVW